MPREDRSVFKVRVSATSVKGNLLVDEDLFLDGRGGLGAETFAKEFRSFVAAEAWAANLLRYGLGSYIVRRAFVVHEASTVKVIATEITPRPDLSANVEGYALTFQSA